MMSTDQKLAEAIDAVIKGRKQHSPDSLEMMKLNLALEQAAAEHKKGLN